MVFMTISLSQSYSQIPSTLPNPDFSINDCENFNVALVLDESGSMGSTGIKAVKNAVLTMANGLKNTGANLAIVEFSSEAWVVNIDQPTNNPSVGAGYELVDDLYLNKLNYYYNLNCSNPRNCYVASGQTRWDLAFDKLLEIRDGSGNVVAPDLILFLTDGNPVGPIGPTQILINTINRTNSIKANFGTHLYGVAVGSNITIGNIINVTGQDEDLCLDIDLTCRNLNPNDPIFAQADYTRKSFEELAFDLSFIAETVCGTTIDLAKTVYAGHDNGLGCNGSNSLSGQVGDPITFCFSVTNNGETDLGEISITDNSLGINETDMTLVAGVVPLPPGSTATYFYETNIPQEGDYVNTALLVASALNENGVAIGLPFSSFDQATVTGLSCIDADNDGFCADEDCNDNAIDIYPGAPDFCGDDIDSDCDGIVANLKDQTVAADNNCMGMAFAVDFNDGSYDINGEPLTFTAVPAGPYPIGTSQVVVTISNGISTDVCNASVTVEDNILPNITCPGDLVSNAEQGSCGANIFWGTPSYSDNCPGAFISSIVSSPTSGLTSGSFFPVGETTITYTVQDLAGNQATCSFKITIIDNQPIEFNGCPSGDLTTSALTGACAAEVFFSRPTAYDNCGIVSFKESSAPTTGLTSGSYFPVGTTTMSYTAIDIHGNSSVCSFDIIVEDNEEMQIINCPSSDLVSSSEPNQCGATVFFDMPYALDNCGIASSNLTSSPTAGLTSGSFFPVGITTITFEAEDSYGNFKFCSFNVIVKDTEAPQFVYCPINTVINADPQQCGAVYSWIAPVAKDNCSEATVTQVGGPVSGSILPVGLTLITYQAIDESGNINYCEFVVTVVDNQPPIIGNCPSDQYVPLNENCQFIIPDYTRGMQFYDNCAVYDIYPFPLPGATVELDPFPVRIRVIDINGLVTNCEFTIYGIDVTPPVIEGCPDDIIVLSEPGECGAVVNWIEPTTTDNCTSAGITQIQGLANGSVFPVGETIIEYISTDIAGNPTSCSFKVTVIDEEPPVISGCPGDIQVYNDPGKCGAIVSWIPPTAYDNCGIPTLNQTLGLANGSEFPVGVTVVRYEAVDQNGISSACEFRVTVRDNEPLVITDCPGDIQINNDPGKCGAVVSWTPPTVSDNCGFPTLNQTLGLSNGSEFPIGVTTVRYAAVDDQNGITYICDFDVIVLDNEPPVIADCPESFTVSNDAGQCGAIVNYSIPTFSDNCSGTTLKLLAGLTSGSFFPVGVTTIIFEATDESGNSRSCSFTIEVKDTETPNIICSSNIISSNDPGECGAVVTFSTPTFWDNCPGATMNLVAGLPSGSFFPIGITTMIYKATDASGNTKSCSFAIEIKDTEAPNITCPSNIVAANDPGDCGAIVVFSPPGFSDNCPGATLSLVSGLPSGSFFPVGTTTVIYEASDASGNTRSCAFTVEVKDTEVPNITCPSNIVAANNPGLCGASVNYTPPVGTDNCPGASTSLVSGLGSGSLFPVGITTETYEVTDASGNKTSCSFTIEVIDNEDPTIICPGDIIQVYDLGETYATVNYSNPNANDNCPGTTVSLLSGLGSGSAFPIGTTTESYIAVDGAGNSASCSFDVTVTKRPSTITYSGDHEEQYSDETVVKATLVDGITGNYIAGETLTFTIGTQSTTAVTDINGVAVSSFIIDQAPGAYLVEVEFDGNEYYQSSSLTEDFDILQENANVSYTGTMYASTGSANSSEATILLTATIEDIDDGNRGEIINADVYFVNRDTGTPINSTPLSVSLISSTLGTVSYEWTVDLGNADSEDFEIGIVVGNYYIRNSSEDNTIILVTKAISERFITGGGYLELCCSEGYLTGDVGTKNNFAFNVKFNKKGTSLQGNIRSLFRRHEADGLVHTYRVKGNKMISLIVNGGYAEFIGQANVQDVTDPLNPISILGNGDFIVKMNDNGEPGIGVDDIVFSLYDRSGQLIYTSNWSPGTNGVPQPTLQLIDGGNIKVHDRSPLALNTITEVRNSEIAAVSSIIEIEAFPNPVTNILNLEVSGLESGPVKIVIQNNLGETILNSSQDYQSGQTITLTIPQQMTQGLYYLSVISGEQTKAIPIIKI